MTTTELYNNMANGEGTAKQPLIFIGHGDPMNALAKNKFTDSLTLLGENLRAENLPKAVLCVSAHWLTRGTWIQASPKPSTIHDFGGFPQALFDVEYPALGSPEYAAETKNLVAGSEITTDWGLDHGAWTVLRHVFPKADIPVYQMSIDYYQSMEYHMNLAAQLDALRSKGVLIVGSGNVVHNLGQSMQRFSEGNPAPFDWAVEFDQWVNDCIVNCNWKELANYDKTTAGKLSVPTPDHYAPLMYIMGLAGAQEPIQTLYESVEYGGISMRTFRLG